MVLFVKVQYDFSQINYILWGMWMAVRTYVKFYKVELWTRRWPEVIAQSLLNSETCLPQNYQDIAHNYLYNPYLHLRVDNHDCSTQNGITIFQKAPLSPVNSSSTLAYSITIIILPCTVTSVNLIRTCSTIVHYLCTSSHTDHHQPQIHDRNSEQYQKSYCVWSLPTLQWVTANR